jgi:hypothetical protein
VEGGGGEASDGGQNLVSRFWPTEGFRLFSMVSDELPDCGFQFLNATVFAALDLPLC